MQRMKELFNINTFIVCQVNPHVVPFISKQTGDVMANKSNRRASSLLKRMLDTELKHWMKQLDVLGMLPRDVKWVAGVLKQTYNGDITIVPRVTLTDYKNLLTNVTPQLFVPAMQETYVLSLARLSQIRSYFGIEREFDRYYERLNRQLMCGQHFVGNEKGNGTPKVWYVPDPTIDIKNLHR